MNMPAPVPFWLVWCPDANTPHYRHPSAESANREADRLAAANPGRNYYVLQPTRCSAAQTITVTRFCDDVPF